ncbi:hypothetical protein [Mycolicibacterium sarraceniae]|uniref:Uncharacterized protein n=1 Tax=Mycolicibacterium sarraceniae TaxID=1534348 RepID=A0A7I7SMA1_9MYCO|nr:hypothetical protein [Mycolicibacterium sarraceniae]BBY57551.1 hypothetical protein MSAR_06870 [Mycolicibacterium sarraceniae]
MLTVVLDRDDMAVPRAICDPEFPGQSHGAYVIAVLGVEHLERDQAMRLIRIDPRFVGLRRAGESLAAR